MSVELHTLAILPATSESYRIIYQDDVLLVVDKPSHLLTVPGRHPANHDCLISRVQQDFPTAQVVHRLDYDTSGLVILPLNKPTLSAISKQFQARTVEKDYLAIVAGDLPANGEINLPIVADADNRPLYKICAQSGKPALTHYSRLADPMLTDSSRVLLKPVTGRSHQLRLHLLSIGHAILGDTLYGTAAIAQRAPRLMLHAYQIRFQHPISGESLQLTAAPPF